MTTLQEHLTARGGGTDTVTSLSARLASRAQLPTPTAEAQFGGQVPRELTTPVGFGGPQLAAKEQPGFGEEVEGFLSTPGATRLGIESAGAIGGGFLAGPPGAVVGTFLGSLASEPIDPSERPFRQARNTAFLEGIFEKGGGLVMGGINRLRQGASGTNLVPGGREAIEQLAESGVVLPPGQPSKSIGVDITQEVTQSSLFGGGKVREAREIAETQAGRDLDDFVETFIAKGGREGVGELAELASTNSRQIWKDRVSAAYAPVDAIAGARVQSGAILERANDVLRKARLGVKNPEAIKFIEDIISSLGKPAKQVGTGVIDASGNEIKRTVPADFSLSFEEAGEILSDLLSVTRSATDPVANAREIAAKRLAPVFDEAMEAAADSLPNAAAKKLWRNARKLQREGAEVHNTKLMRSLARQQPETFFQTSVRALRPGTIRNVRTAINDPVVWKQIQGQWMLDLLSSAKKVGSEIPQGGSAISKIDKFGEEALKELLPDRGQRETFRRLAKTLEIAQAPVGKNIPGGIFIQLTQAGSLVAGAQQALSGNLDPSEAAGIGAILIGPVVAANLLINPKFARWATLGSKAKPGSKRFAEALAGISSLVAQETSRVNARREARQERESRVAGLNPAPTAIP